MSTVLTVPDLAQRFQQPTHRVRYAIKSRNIHPVGKAGGVNLFSENQVPAIRAAIDSLANRAQSGDDTSPVPQEPRP